MKKFEVGHVYLTSTLATMKPFPPSRSSSAPQRRSSLSATARPAAQSSTRTATASISSLTTIPWPASTAQSGSCWTRSRSSPPPPLPSRSSLPQRITPSVSRLLHRLPPLATLSLARWLTTPCAKWCFPSLTRATCGQRNWTSLQPSPTAPAAWPDKGRCWAFWQRLFFCPIYSQMRVKMLS